MFLVMSLVQLGSLLEVLNKVGDLIIIIVIVSTLGGTSLCGTDLCSVLSELVHGLRTELGDDTRKEIGQSLLLTTSVDGKGVARDACLNLRLLDVDDITVGLEDVDLLNTV